MDWLVRLPQIIWSVLLIYIVFVIPLEMIIHELGHYICFKKYGIRVKFLQIGIGRLFSWRNKKGTRFIIGIPILKAECRALGEGEDRKREQNNPGSIYYCHRHPKELVAVALGGPVFSLIVAFFLFLVYLIPLFPAMPIAELIFALVFLNEIINILLPFKIPLPILKKVMPNIYQILIFTAPTDAWMIYANLWRWYKLPRISNK